MKVSQLVLLLIIAFLVTGCLDKATDQNQESQIQALRQKLDENTAAEIAAQLPQGCLGKDVTDGPGLIVIFCGVSPQYLIFDPALIQGQGQGFNVQPREIQFIFNDLGPTAMISKIVESAPVCEGTTALMHSFDNEAQVAQVFDGNDFFFVLPTEFNSPEQFGIQCEGEGIDIPNQDQQSILNVVGLKQFVPTLGSPTSEEFSLDCSNDDAFADADGDGQFDDIVMDIVYLEGTKLVVEKRWYLDRGSICHDPVIQQVDSHDIVDRYEADWNVTLPFFIDGKGSGNFDFNFIFGSASRTAVNASGVTALSLGSGFCGESNWQIGVPVAFPVQGASAGQCDNGSQIPEFSEENLHFGWSMPPGVIGASVTHFTRPGALNEAIDINFDFGPNDPENGLQQFILKDHLFDQNQNN